MGVGKFLRGIRQRLWGGGKAESQATDLEAFLDFGEWLHTPQSGWIESAQYSRRDQQLTIELQNGSFYTKGADPYEAEGFYRASSKGTWVWENGWRTGEFVLLTGPSRKLPRWAK